MNWLEFSLSGFQNQLLFSRNKGALINFNGETSECEVIETRTPSGDLRFDVKIEGRKVLDFYLWHLEVSESLRGLPGYAVYNLNNVTSLGGNAVLMIPVTSTDKASE